jgi:hypothetical protein
MDSDYDLWDLGKLIRVLKKTRDEVFVWGMQEDFSLLMNFLSSNLVRGTALFNQERTA